MKISFEVTDQRGESKRGDECVWWGWYRSDEGGFYWDVHGNNDLGYWKIDGVCPSRADAEEFIRSTVEEWRWLGA